jgi:hypothetical protein
VLKILNLDDMRDFGISDIHSDCGQAAADVSRPLMPAHCGEGLGGPDPGDFSFKPGCPTSLLGGANCTISLIFKPTTTGTRTATLSITDAVGTQTTSLTGIGEPTITSFTPTSGPAGTLVTITGTSLTGTTKVTFGGVAATTFTVKSATQVTAKVPTGAQTGKIGITTNGVTIASSPTYTVN